MAGPVIAGQIMPAPAWHHPSPPHLAGFRSGCMVNDMSYGVPLTQARTLRMTTPEVEQARLARQRSIARYREKRDRRMFEKKIRYQSRKVYAEARPRVKGRFVKRCADDASLAEAAAAVRCSPALLAADQEVGSTCVSA